MRIKKMKNSSYRNSFYRLFSTQTGSHVGYKILLVIFIYLMLCAVMIFQNYTVTNRIKINDVISKDIIVEEDMNYVDEEASARNEEILRMVNPPYYVWNKTFSDQRLTDLSSILSESTQNDEYSAVKEFADSVNIVFSENDYQVFRKMVAADPEEKQKILMLAQEFYSRGIIKLTPAILSKIEVSGVKVMGDRNGGRNETLFSSEEVSGFELENTQIRQSVKSVFWKSSEFEKKVLENFFINFFVPNIQYDPEKTETDLKEKLKTERDVFKKILKGQIVARRGDLVTTQNLSLISAVLSYKQNHITFRSIVSYFLVNLFLLLLFFFLIYFYDNHFFDDIKNLFFVLLIYLVFVLYLTLPFNLDRSSYFFGVLVPISAITVTMIFLYSKIVAILITIIFALTFFLISGYNSSSFVFVFFSGICSVFAIKDMVKKRSDLLVAGVYIALLNAIIAFTASFYDGLSWYEIGKFLIFGVFNGIISSVFAIGLIALGEILLNSPTVFRLQELSDTSSPILKELFDNAIGTYNHSINVANLAEAAAYEIEANGLLAKVGGFYHDIGKIGNAMYFVENQGDYNPHSELNPAISATIIKSHVKRGVERAKEARLPQEIIDIIHQHHGNSVIQYFYGEALKRKTADEEISMDVFQYKADNPQFPEAAIVMMADQVEAIARVMKKASQESFTDLVNKVVDEKFKDGILNDSGLTLKDLTKIKKVFVKLLVGMYHSRIDYPEPLKVEAAESGIKKEDETDRGIIEVTKSEET